MNRQYTKHDAGQYFKFEGIGQKLEGKLIGIKNVDTEYGAARMATLLTDDGLRLNFIVTSGMFLDDSMVGMFILIEYVGDEKNPKTKRTYKKFDIYTAKPDFEELPF